MRVAGHLGTMIGTCLALACVFALFPKTPAWGQTFDLIHQQLYEPLLGSPTFHHARAVALGGAYSVLVTDGSALWYNPASLGRVDRTEIQAELVWDKVQGESDSLTGTPDAPPPSVSPMTSSLSRTRLGSAYLAIPISGPQGWTLGLGTAMTHRLDRALAADLTYAPGTFVQILNPNPDSFEAEEIEKYSYSDDQRGAVWAWQFGVGGHISPAVMIGAAGVYYDGYLEFNNRTSLSATRYEDTSSATPGFPIHWDLTATTIEDLRGWGFNGGIFLRPMNNVGISAVFRSPVTYEIENDQYITEQRDGDTVVGFSPTPTVRWLKTPLSATLGAALRIRGLAVAGDVTVTDWSQSEYKDSPYLTRYNELLKLTYREEIAWSLGAEFSPLQGPIAFRAGVRNALLQYNEKYVVDDHWTLSAGLGFFIDRVMHLDLAVSYDTYSGRNPLYGFNENYEQARALVTTSFRFD